MLRVSYVSSQCSAANVYPLKASSRCLNVREADQLTSSLCDLATIKSQMGCVIYCNASGRGQRGQRTGRLSDLPWLRVWWRHTILKKLIGAGQHPLSQQPRNVRVADDVVVLGFRRVSPFNSQRVYAVGMECVRPKRVAAAGGAAHPAPQDFP